MFAAVNESGYGAVCRPAAFRPGNAEADLYLGSSTVST
jgi:hypothetical protein